MGAAQGRKASKNAPEKAPPLQEEHTQKTFNLSSLILKAMPANNHHPPVTTGREDKCSLLLGALPVGSNHHVLRLFSIHILPTLPCVTPLRSMGVALVQLEGGFALLHVRSAVCSVALVLFAHTTVHSVG